jgi:hypothetical protein
MEGPLDLLDRLSIESSVLLRLCCLKLCGEVACGVWVLFMCSCDRSRPPGAHSVRFTRPFPSPFPILTCLSLFSMAAPRGPGPSRAPAAPPLGAALPVFRLISSTAAQGGFPPPPLSALCTPLLSPPPAGTSLLDNFPRYRCLLPPLSPLLYINSFSFYAPTLIFLCFPSRRTPDDYELLLMLIICLRLPCYPRGGRAGHSYV